MVDENQNVEIVEEDDNLDEEDTTKKLKIELIKTQLS